jgi:hypothetical protein
LLGQKLANTIGIAAAIGAAGRIAAIAATARRKTDKHKDAQKDAQANSD